MNFEFDKTRKAIPQGDVYLIPILAVPVEAKAVDAENGHYIVTHSETGHHHVVKERDDIQMFKGMDMFRDFLNVEIENIAVEIEGRTADNRIVEFELFDGLHGLVTCETAV